MGGQVPHQPARHGGRHEQVFWHSTQWLTARPVRNVPMSPGWTRSLFHERCKNLDGITGSSPEA
jgi:hypothetical protein